MAFLAVAELSSVTGLAKDKATNSFAIIGGDPASDASRELVIDSIAALYTHQDMANILSNDVSRATGGLTVKLYDITGALTIGANHGSPIDSGTYTIPAGMNDVALPAEVSIAVTLYATGRAEAAVEEADGDRPKQRRTGRIYLGPVSAAVINDTGGPSRVHQTYMDMIGARFDALQTALVAGAAGESLAVWSRVDAAVRAVTSVAIDNAFDTQRRRGHAPTGRTVYPVGP